MKDPEFINQLLESGRLAKQRAQSEFAGLGLEQLNWKPSPESWSIGQCLDHLLVSDMLYFPTFKKIAEGKFKNSWWEKWSPLSGLFGRMLVHVTGEKVKKKIRTARVLNPSMGNIDHGIHDRFQKHLDTFLAYTAVFSNEDLDKIRITSPVSKLITYSLRHALQMLYQHLHRHINQGIKVNSKYLSVSG